MSDSSFRVLVGRVEDGTDLWLDLASPSHILIQGMTQLSGKSNLARVILAPFGGRANVSVYGADPSHLLLACWGAGSTDRIALGTGNMAAAAACLTNAVAEMDRRIASLSAKRVDRLDIAEQGILFVVLEEYAGVLAAAESEDAEKGRKPTDRVAPRIQRAVRRLIQEGAKVGVRVVMLLQRAEAQIVGGAERSNFGTRFTLRVDNADAVRMLHPNATPEQIAQVATFQPGMGLVEMPGYLGIRIMRADHLSFSRYLEAVKGATHD